MPRCGRAGIQREEDEPLGTTTVLDIFSRMRSRLAPHKRVRRIEFCELPKTISGKIRRGEQRRQEAARRQAGVRGPAEFWEEDFPEISGRSRAANVA